MSNTIVIAGNVGKDPEARETAKGTKTAKFSIASKTGKDKTSWFNVTAFGKTAEFILEYVQKGTALYVTGYVEIEKGKDEKYYTNVIAERVGFLGAKKKEDDSSSQEQTYEADKAASGGGGMDDEIPFMRYQGSL